MNNSVRTPKHGQQKGSFINLLRWRRNNRFVGRGVSFEECELVHRAAA